MTTQVVKYELAKPEDFTIESIDEAGRVLKDNNIIPNYHKHLKQVNICILKFEELRLVDLMENGLVIGLMGHEQSNRQGANPTS